MLLTVKLANLLPARNRLGTRVCYEPRSQNFDWELGNIYVTVGVRHVGGEVSGSSSLCRNNACQIVSFLSAFCIRSSGETNAEVIRAEGPCRPVRQKPPNYIVFPAYLGGATWKRSSCF
jgi:hypothetical protein